MMRGTCLFLLCLLAMPATAAVAAPVPWYSIGGDTGTRVVGHGDVTSDQGASVEIRVKKIGKAGFAGAIASLDPTPFLGREVELRGDLQAEGSGQSGALWLRADGPTGALAFANTQKQPVAADGGQQTRSIRLFIPTATTAIRLGAFATAKGQVDVQALTLRVRPDEPSLSNAHAVLDAAMQAMAEQALMAGRLDWAAERRQRLHDELKQADRREAYPVIKDLLKALGDRHSFLMPPEAAARIAKTGTPSQPVTAHAEAGIGYLLVPGITGTDAEATARFSAALCGALATHASRADRGWIIDLRQNTGGNMWPMLAGLAPLLGEAVPGFFQTRSGERSAWQVAPSADCTAKPIADRVAVLIGPRTASSGEAVAVAFRGRAATRFFGQPTAGLSTGNQNIALPDGARLMLTTSVYVDRNGQAYPAGIAPDSLQATDEDTLAAARIWLVSGDVPENHARR